MKYCVENDLSLFEFHDSEFSFLNFDGQNLIISAELVNIHKDAAENPYDCDMELGSAEMKFINFRSAIYEPGRAWETDADGNAYPVGPQIVFSGQEAMERILNELKHGIAVYCFEKEEQGGYSIGGCGIEPYFEIKFEFDNVVVSWDEFRKKAWYELHRRYQYEAVMDTPDGDETVDLMVYCHEEPLSVNVGCAFQGKEYWGRGRDWLWIDAVADLQRQLPDGISFKCCLACRHGNFCPVGNDVNEVFCTKDILIHQKSDLYFYTEDRGEREKRSRKYFDLCDGFVAQGEDFFTYNDFLFYLKN